MKESFSISEIVEVCKRRKGWCYGCAAGYVKDGKPHCNIMKAVTNGVVLKPGFWNVGQINNAVKAENDHFDKKLREESEWKNRN